MRKCIYYVTVSADGFIATEDGSTHWMSGAPRSDYGFGAFYESISTILMGRKTYEKILDISKDSYFPYEDKEVYVASRSNDYDTHSQEVGLIAQDNLAQEIARLKLQNKDGDIWVAGGAEFATELLELGLIDEVHIFMQPLLLGSGISLFSKLEKPRTLRLATCEKWPGDIVELRYLTVKSWRVDI